MQKEEGKRAKKVHSVLNTIRTFIIATFVIIIIAAIVLNAKSINMDNFRRLLAKIDFSMNASAKAGEINFTANENNVIMPFKGGIALQATDGLTIFDKSGNEFSSFNVTYKNPILKASEKYLLTCDKDGKSLKITNSFAIVFEKEFEQKIINTTIGDNGSFAVLTSADGYKSNVAVFSPNFKEEFSASFADRYVVDIALSSDGNTIAIASLSPDNGNTNSIISFYKTNSDKAYKEITLPISEVFKIAFRSGDSLVAITPDVAYCYSKQGEELSKINFEGNILLTYDLANPEYSTFITTATETDTPAKIYISDNNKTSISGRLSDVPVSVSELSTGVAILYREKLVEVKYNKTKLEETEIVVLDKEVVSILTDNNTIYLLEGDKITSVEVK